MTKRLSLILIAIIMGVAMLFPGKVNAVCSDAPEQYDRDNLPSPRRNFGTTSEWQDATDATRKIRSVSLDYSSYPTLDTDFAFDSYQQTFWKKYRTNESGNEVVDVDCTSVIYEFPGQAPIEYIYFAAHDRNQSQSMVVKTRRTQSSGWDEIDLTGKLEKYKNTSWMTQSPVAGKADRFAIDSESCEGPTEDGVTFDSPRPEDDECFLVYRLKIDDTIQAVLFQLDATTTEGNTLMRYVSDDLNIRNYGSGEALSGPGGQENDAQVRFLKTIFGCIPVQKACASDGRSAAVRWEPITGVAGYIFRFDSNSSDTSPTWFLDGVSQPGDIGPVFTTAIDAFFPLEVPTPNRVAVQASPNGSSCWYDLNLDCPPTPLPSISCVDIGAPVAQGSNSYLASTQANVDAGHSVATFNYSVTSGTTPSSVTNGITNSLGESIQSSLIWQLPPVVGEYSFLAYYTNNEGLMSNLCSQWQQVVPPACISTTIVPTRQPIGVDSPVAVSCGQDSAATTYRLSYPTNSTDGTPDLVSWGAGTAEDPFSFVTNLINAPAPSFERILTLSCQPCLSSDESTCASITPDCQAQLTIGCTCGQVADVAVTDADGIPLNLPLTLDPLEPPSLSWTLQTVTGANPIASFGVTIQAVNGEGNVVGTTVSITKTTDELTSQSLTGKTAYRFALSRLEVLDIINRLNANDGTGFRITVIPSCGCPGGPSSVEAGVTVPPPPVEKIVHTFAVKDVTNGGACNAEGINASIADLTGTLRASPETGPESTDSDNPYYLKYELDPDVSAQASFDNLPIEFQCACGLSATTCQTSLEANNPVHVVYIERRQVASWWSTVGGLVASQTVASELPSAYYNLLCLASDSICHPYFGRSPDFAQNKSGSLSFASTLSVNLGWLAERDNINEHAGEAGSPPKAPLTPLAVLKQDGGSVYEYYKKLIPADQLTSKSQNALTTLPTADSGKPDYFVLTPSSGTTITLDPTSTITVGSNQKYILFINGDLVVKDSGGIGQITTVNSGGFLAMFVKGSIAIDDTVGTKFEDTADAASNLGIGQLPPLPAHLSGIFVTDGNMVVDSNDETVSDPDRRFIGEGSFIAKGGIELKREFKRTEVLPSLLWSAYTPSEVFRHSPEQVLATPAELRTAFSQYEEVR